MTTTQLHVDFMTIMPRIETHARIVFSDVKCAETRKDRISEAIALSWKWFVRLAERGKDATNFPSVLATLAARHVWAGRRLCGQERAKDVMSPVAQQRYGFTVGSLPSSPRISHENLYAKPCSQRMQDAFEERLRDNTQTPVPEQVSFRLDFPVWLCSLSDRDQRVVEDLALGHRTMDVANKYGLSPARVSQLRDQFERDWRMFVGDLPKKAQAEVAGAA